MKRLRKELERVRSISKKLDIDVKIPQPWDKSWKNHNRNCLTFWNRLQIGPDKNIAEDKWIGNTFPSQCNATVIGKLNTLGNLMDFKDFMEFWNNKKLIRIRRKLINGKFPDEMCQYCYKYPKFI